MAARKRAIPFMPPPAAPPMPPLWVSRPLYSDWDMWENELFDDV